MGNSSDHTFDTHNWKFVSKPQNYDIVQDERTGIHAQKHVIANNPTISQHDEMEVYRYRNQTDKPIVKVYDAEYVKNKAGGACGAAKDIVVHSEYIPHRLSDTRNLNHGQALYVLSESLAGFHELYHRFGPFQITDDHIGFNQIGQAKVWHSPNFASNHLDRDNIILMSTVNPKNFDQRMEKRQQQEMVEDIWMAVDQHANISPQFTNRANYFREKNFVDARRLVSQQIARGATYVPEYLNFDGNAQRSSAVQQYGSESHVQNMKTSAYIPAPNTQVNTAQPLRTIQPHFISQPAPAQFNSNLNPQQSTVYQNTYTQNLPLRQGTAISQLSPFMSTAPQLNNNAYILRQNQPLPVITQQHLSQQSQNITVDPRYQTSMVYNYNPNNNLNNQNMRFTADQKVVNYGPSHNSY